MASPVLGARIVVALPSNPSAAALIARLYEEGSRVWTADSIRQMTELCHDVKPHLTLLASELPDGSGLQALSQLRCMGQTGPKVS